MLRKGKLPSGGHFSFSGARPFQAIMFKLSINNKVIQGN